MAYPNSLYLFVFLPAVLLAYQCMPRRLRWAVLLLAGYVFFWLISGKLLLVLIGTTLFVYGAGRAMERIKQGGASAEKEEAEESRKSRKKKEKRLLIFGIGILLLLLAYLKYYNFFVGNVNPLLIRLNLPVLKGVRDLAAPIGISFYTLEAIGYLTDVYWEKIPAEHHLGKLALFLSFFPQIMEGPISLYEQTSDALWAGEPLRAENLSQGCVRILWGLFKKMIVADRLNVLVAAVFDNYESYHGLVVAAAAVAYAVQLYMEFSGCMDIIIGSGKLFGVALPENFRQPFASRNASEFWRRWHITLGVWFKTYVFYPVSVSGLVKKWNRFARKKFGKYAAKLGVSALALFPVWICNGLWHGPSWNYIFYGIYYFVILLAGIAVEPLRNRAVRAFHIREDALWFITLQRAKTWVIIFTGELFFRANGLKAGFLMFRSIFSGFALQPLWNGTFLKFGLDAADYLAIGAGCAVVAVVGMINERNLTGELGIRGMKLPIRWALYYALILAVVIFGAYGIGYQQVDMIYAGF